MPTEPFDEYHQNPYAAPQSELHSGPSYDPDFIGLDKETRQWAMILHLSQFAGYMIPFAGFLAPILIWQLKKDELPGIDDHGREVVNWIISEVIYGFAFAVLCLIFIGIPLLMALGIVGVVFPIIGAVKAADGQFWRYPGCIRLL